MKKLATMVVSVFAFTAGPAFAEDATPAPTGDAVKEAPAKAKRIRPGKLRMGKVLGAIRAPGICGKKCLDKRPTKEDGQKYRECMKPVYEQRKAKRAELKGKPKAERLAAMKEMIAETKTKADACRTDSMKAWNECIKSCREEIKAKKAEGQKAPTPAPDKPADAK